MRDSQSARRQNRGRRDNLNLQGRKIKERGCLSILLTERDLNLQGGKKSGTLRGNLNLEGEGVQWETEGCNLNLQEGI